ncbi:shikimate kinase [Pedobacter sp. UYP30]|uniref:shikimate kinase n=1 Tax=Pedobacter sp. UYP30 TaxID=1756400 RepID=UPI0033921337
MKKLTTYMNDGKKKPLQGLGLIFFIGFMGCGKSTKAKQLANKLSCSLIDLDDEMEKKVGQSIGDYFAEFGEAKFRQLEAETLKNYPYPENCVIATGGGLPCFFDNMDWMKANGKTVYLQMQPAQLVSRLQNREKRPLIKDMTEQELLAFIEIKLGERNKFYLQAEIIVDAFNLGLDELIAQF